MSAIILCSIYLQAQGTSFGLRAGVNFQNINGKELDGDDLKNDMLIAYHIGVNAEIPIAPEFYFQPGLLFTVKGAKNEEVILTETFNSSVKISYIELPLNFLFKPMLGNGHLLLGAGPYVAYGIGGKYNREGGGITLNQDVEFKNNVTISDIDNDVSYFRALDAGANLLAGYEFSNRVSFQLNAQLGLIDINSEYDFIVDDKTSSKNTGFGMSLGYRF
ncbi:MAG: PorT family protein [Bacteroidota bacterium]|nr:PorT family protein [Bacteroidota bacterium]